MAAGARRRDGLQKFREFAPLVEFVRKRRPRVVLEIGTWTGGTLWAWCRCAAPDALIISVDLPKGVGEEAVTKRLAGYALPGQSLQLLRMDSHDPATLSKLRQLLDGRQIDFAFIDGDHSYEGVRADFEMYGPLVDGYVAFHDVAPQDWEPGVEVDRFWKELSPGRETWEFVDPYDDKLHPDWGGIGVLRVGE